MSRSASSLALRARGDAALGLARRHWPLLVLLAAGCALRAVTFFAYRPALVNSIEYLVYADELEPKSYQGHPIGYPAFLRLLPLEHGLWLVPLVQHLLGLAIAVLVYVLLLRLGVRRGLAALATAPVLLDAYQLSLEQYVLAETLFELLVLGACAALVWRRPLGTVAAVATGLLLAAATLTRSIAVLLVVPALATAVALRARARRLAALAGAFALPLGAYAVWFHSVHGVYGLTASEGRFLYGRVMTFADCRRFPVAAHERVLCVEGPPAQRPPLNELLWAPRYSPVVRVVPPPGMTRNDVAGDFAKRVVAHQPLDYLGAVAADFARGFSLRRGLAPGEFGAPPWQFHVRYPTLYRGSVCSRRATTPGSGLPADVARARATACRVRRRILAEQLQAHGHGRPHADRRLTVWLHRYGRLAATPGPVLGAALLAGVLAAAGLGRARRSPLRPAALLFALVSLALSLGSVAISWFSWRYLVPMLVFLPVAGVTGLAALLGRPDPAAGGAAPAAPVDA